MIPITTLQEAEQLKDDWEGMPFNDFCNKYQTPEFIIEAKYEVNNILRVFNLSLYQDEIN